ncbi:MAG: Hpt domain-containing protein [Fimbriimonadaceae bacterium]|nr:Hpt domain-containing protein [Chitinophagales bacterium]
MNQFALDDPVKMKKYIGMFLQSAPQAIAKMKEQHSAKDWVHLKTTAHSLKPQLAYMGIESLKENILRIEEYAGDEKNHDVILQLIETVEKKCAVAFAELSNVVEELSKT